MVCTASHGGSHMDLVHLAGISVCSMFYVIVVSRVQSDAGDYMDEGRRESWVDSSALNVRIYWSRFLLSTAFL